MLFGMIIVLSAIGFGIGARIVHDLVAREDDDDRASWEFLLVLSGMLALICGVIVLTAVKSGHWPLLIAIVAVGTAAAVGATWRESFPRIGRGLMHPRVLRPLAIGAVAIGGIWLFGVNLAFRSVVLQLVFLGFAVWLLLNLFRPFKVTKKKN